MRLMYSSDWSWVWENRFYSIGDFECLAGGGGEEEERAGRGDGT